MENSIVFCFIHFPSLPWCVEDEEGNDSEEEDHGKFAVFPLLVRSPLSSQSLALGNVINVHFSIRLQLHKNTFSETPASAIVHH